MFSSLKMTQQKAAEIILNGHSN